MRVLVACEFSGAVREAFMARGHDAWSCDLLPSEPLPVTGWPPSNHLQGDVFKVANLPVFDLMIAFPPCTDLCVSGARWFPAKRASGEQQRSIAFFLALANCEIPKIAIENPIGIMSRHYRKPDQIIQPWQFGHPESKSTCLWLKSLPKLKATNILTIPASGRWENQTASGQNKLTPSPDRWRLRSKTYAGIAAAMAEQWGGLNQIKNEITPL